MNNIIIRPLRNDQLIAAILTFILLYAARPTAIAAKLEKNNSLGTINCGQIITGTNSSPGQKDSYQFSGNTGEAVVIAAKAIGGNLCMYAELYDPTGKLVSYNPCNGQTQSLQLTATGIYTILVYDSGLDGTGTYAVNLQFTTGRCATPIACGQTINGNITSQAQQDAYKFSGNAGESVVIAANVVSGNLCIYAELYDPSGKSVSYNSCNGQTQSLKLATTGVYTIIAYDAGIDGTGTYALSLQFTTGRCAVPLACGQTLSGNIISRAQLDAYKFSGNAGESVVIAANVLAGNLCMYTELYDPAGKLISYNPCNGQTQSLKLTATGTHTIIAYDSGLDGTGAYAVNLQISTGRCGKPILCGQTLHGTLTSKAQQDAFTFCGLANTSVVISATKTSGNACVYAELFGPAGNSLGYNSCNGSTSSLKLPTTGLYTILAYDAGLNDTSKYDINLSCLGPPCSCNYTITPPSQTFGFSGGSSSVSVLVDSVCAWTAAARASWITILSGNSGKGNGVVNYRVAANSTSTSRVDTIAIADKKFVVKQDGTNQTTLSASPTTLSPGDTLTATWSGIVSPTTKDWIGLYILGAADTDYKDYRYTTGAASGRMLYPLSPTLIPGTYELRLFPNDTYARLAVSNAFTVVPRATNRIVRVVNANSFPGGSVNVPIELVAQGDENALGFTLTFDPAVLGSPQITRGKDASAVALIEFC